MRWMTAVAALSLLAVSTEPVGMAIEKPNTEATEQQIQAPGQESGSAQQPPESKKRKRRRTLSPEKQQRREKGAEKKAQKKAVKKEAKKAKRAAGPKEGRPGQLQSRIAKATDPSLSDRVRQKAILALVRSKHPEADSALLGLARNRKEPLHIRVWALQDLGRNNQSELMGPLREILREPEEPPLVRAEAAAGLGRIGTPVAVEALLAALDDKAPAVRVRAILGLQGRVPDPIQLLGRLLHDEEISGEHRAYAAKLLGWSGDPGAADPLIKAIATRPKVTSSPQNSGSAKVSAPANAGGSDSAAPPAASSAEPMKIELTIETLVLAEQRRFNHRLFSVVALGRLKEKRAIPTLLEALKSDPDHEVRAESARTLLILAGPGAEEAFIGALKDEDPAVRVESAVALKQVGGQKAVKPFIEALKDSDRRVRFQAAEGLGRLGPTVANEAIDALKEAAEQEKIGFIKKAHLAALEKLLAPAPSKSDKEAGS